MKMLTFYYNYSIISLIVASWIIFGMEGVIIPKISYILKHNPFMLDSNFI